MSGGFISPREASTHSEPLAHLYSANQELPTSPERHGEEEAGTHGPNICYNIIELANKKQTYLVIGEGNKGTIVRLATAFSPEEAISISRRIDVLHDWRVYELESNKPSLSANPFP